VRVTVGRGELPRDEGAQEDRDGLADQGHGSQAPGQLPRHSGQGKRTHRRAFCQTPRPDPPSGTSPPHRWPPSPDRTPRLDASHPAGRLDSTPTRARTPQTAPDAQNRARETTRWYGRVAGAAVRRRVPPTFPCTPGAVVRRLPCGPGHGRRVRWGAKRARWRGRWGWKGAGWRGRWGLGASSRGVRWVGGQVVVTPRSIRTSAAVWTEPVARTAPPTPPSSASAAAVSRASGRSRTTVTRASPKI